MRISSCDAEIGVGTSFSLKQSLGLCYFKRILLVIITRNVNVNDAMLS